MPAHESRESSHDDEEKASSPTHFEGSGYQAVDVDDAIRVLQAHTHEVAVTAEEERTVRYLVDLWLMPFLVLVYMFNYIDKAIFSTGANFNLVQDLHLFVIQGKATNTQRYSNATTVYYCGFIAGAFVFALLAQRFQTTRVLGIAVVLWGTVASATAALHTYEGTMIQRTFLGFCEAGVLPCLVLWTSSWYTKYEQACRIAVWYSGAGLGIIVSTPINYGLLHIKGSIAAWRILYCFWGPLTVVFGFFVFFFVPATPVNAWIFNDRQKYVAVERLRQNQSGIANHHFKWDQAKEFLLDIKVFLLGLILFCASTANGATSAFNPILFKTLLHASAYRSLILNIPAGIVSIVVTLISGYLVQKVHKVQAITVIVIQLVVFIGALVLWLIPKTNESGLFAGIYLLSFFLGAVVCTYGLGTANTAGYTKKTLTSAWLVIAVQAGNAAGPEFFLGTEAPEYTSGFIALTILYAAGMLMAGIYAFLCWRENRHRDTLGAEAQVDRAFTDMTDKKNLTFRYIY